MDIQMESGDNGERMALSGEMTIFSALQSKSQLLEASRGNKALDVDLSQVSEFDVAGLQLIAMMKREALAQGNTLRFVSHSAAVSEVLQLCNLEALFDVDVAAV